MQQLKVINDLASIDPGEVAHYTALADTWWDREGPFWPLHVLNELRVAYLRDRLCEYFHRDASRDQPLKGLRILDIGCGGGILSESMARLGAQVHGIDVVERNIIIAARHARQSDLDIHYQLITAERLSKQQVAYDTVLNMEVVEHVADLPGFLNACADLVQPQGLMCVATLNRNPLSWLFAIVGAEYLFRLLPKGTHQWRRFRKPQEISKYLAQKDMRVMAGTGVRVNPLTRRMALIDSLAVNYMLVAQKQSGQIYGDQQTRSGDARPGCCGNPSSA